MVMIIDAKEAYKRTSEAYDLIAQEKFEDFKKEADKCITNAINFGRWNCCIPCNIRAKDLACGWLKSYGYKVSFDFDCVSVDWGECE